MLKEDYQEVETITCFFSTRLFCNSGNILRCWEYGKWGRNGEFRMGFHRARWLNGWLRMKGFSRGDQWRLDTCVDRLEKALMLKRASHLLSP
ncbi:hypothetical protein SLEP1_g2528 [Rubroshorea leprosula]|uniref:Uncharacterized protein n=1 Tax=Rubroshorea leprosula TaxID=152421 RepID=A0AAV5HP14_9ROSI|nr:hypothetical protein SLEP1_g2528 [Rubroshorea leprosula]